MCSSLFDELSAAAALAAYVYEGRLLSHDSRGTIGIVAETGGITHQETLRIPKQGVEGIRCFASFGPGEDSAVRNDGLGEVIVEEAMHHVDSVAHPFAGDAAGEFVVEAELKIDSRVEWAVGFVGEPFSPVRIFFADTLHFRAAAPTRAVEVSHDLYFSYRSDGSAGGLRLVEDVCHELFAVGSLVSFGG